MLPQPQPKPEPLDEEVVLDHHNWLSQPYTRRVVKLLEAENYTRIAELLNYFPSLPEPQLHAALQQIKTQRNILQCLNKPIPPQK